MTGGALPEHVFWQVAGKVELGTTAHLEGIVLTKTEVTLGTGASVLGRVMAQTAISLDANTVVQPAQ
ncbi:MAG: ice-binding family protein [Kofleriaceae bacterium]